jgi:fructokinase
LTVELFGGIEAGGTHFVCAIGPSAEAIEHRIEIPTADPVSTIGRVIAFFRAHAAGGALRAVGLASFGPLDLERGLITSTPKRGWVNTEIVRPLSDALGVEVHLDTDVNAAALAEGRWGAAQGRHSFVYLTVGTGIGGGAQVDGHLLHGDGHPEMGHLHLPHDLVRDPFLGSCPYHGDCWEGLASGQAIRERWGSDGESLADRSDVWSLEARYLAIGIADLIQVLAPQMVIAGGGVLRHEGLLTLVREELPDLLGTYANAHRVLESFLVAPGLGAQAGVMGAMALAQGVVS